MGVLQVVSLLALTARAAVAPDHAHRSPVLGTATINLARPIGTPQHLAAGFLYGIPDTPDQVPGHFYTEMGFNYGRAGGSQLGSPARGWVYGTTEFNNRFASAVSNYKTIRKYGATMQLLIADIWGADGTAKIEMPGDNGNWTNYDNFLTALIDAINSNVMTTSLDIEIWNEPDLTNVFWQRTQDQYLQMWGRGYARLRAAFPRNSITGPCLASSPSSTNAWYEAYLQFVKTNNTIPDSYCWHLESGSGDDIGVTIPAFDALLEKYALPSKPLVLNEYGVKTEQQPGGSSWYISRLERYGVRGLRGNWGSNGALHDYFAGLLGKPNAGTSSYSLTQAGYWGNGEYNVYKYYYQNMTGQRVQTIGSPDGLFDVFATKGKACNSVKMLCGTRLAAGNWDILVTGLSSVGLPSRGSVTVRSHQFNYTDGEFGNVPAPIDQGTTTYKYKKDQLLLHVSTDKTTAYAFEFV